MSATKEGLFEEMERHTNALLAKVLGIKLEELEETTFELDEIQTDEGIVTNGLVKFSDGPREILDKIGVEKGETEYSIDANAISNAEFRYKHYAEKLGLSYPELLSCDTTESDIVEKSGEPGLYLKFDPQTPFEILEKIKHNGLTDQWETWVPLS